VARKTIPTATAIPAIAPVDRLLPVSNEDVFVEAGFVFEVVRCFVWVEVEDAMGNPRGADLGVNESRSLDAHATVIGYAAATKVVTVIIVSLALLTSVVLVGVETVLSHPLKGGRL
jgi:hypothetical protein